MALGEDLLSDAEVRDRLGFDLPAERSPIGESRRTRGAGAPNGAPAEPVTGVGWQVPDVDTFGDVDDVRPDGASWTLLFELIDRHRPAWQADALCREYADTVTWFPERGQSSAPAKAVCAGCLVVDACRTYAVEHAVRHGVWGGGSLGRRRRNAA